MNNRSKAQLKELVNEHGLTVPSKITRQVLAELLATKYRGDTAAEPAAGPAEPAAGPAEPAVSTAEPAVSPAAPAVSPAAPAVTVANAVDEDAARVAFLQRMMPHWFMRPFQARPDSAVDQGLQNEALVIDALPRAVKKFSDGKYKIQDVREFGLLARRDVPSCASSPDGVVALMRKEGDSTYSFVSLAVLEMKTKASGRTAAELDLHIAGTGTRFEECDAGTGAFRSAVPEPSYRTQLCQHATALGLDYVLMVYSKPGASVQRIVLLHISEAQRKKLLDLQKGLALKYMQFAYGPEAPGELPRLGDDYSVAYGYATEHHTLDVWLFLWCAYSRDVRENGTPPTFTRFVDLLINTWNKFMGFVDTVRKVLKGVRAKRGPNSKPGSLLWDTFFDYQFFNAFRVYQYALLEDQMDTFTSFEQVKKARQKITFKQFCFGLCEKDELHADSMSKFFPGLREKIDRGFSAHRSAQTESHVHVDRTVRVDQEQPDFAGKKYNVISLLGDPNSDFNKRRLSKEPRHIHASTSSRRRCIICCEECAKDGEPKEHYRRGSQSTKMCSVCQVYLCKQCFAPFHEQERPTLPPCSTITLPGPKTRRSSQASDLSRRAKKKQRPNASPTTTPPPPPQVI